jgi:hypothetical protein
MTTIDWIDSEEYLPKEGEWVLGYSPDRPWSTRVEKVRHKISVVCFHQGRENPGNVIYAQDKDGNNKKPYNWTTFGANSFFGQEITKWAYIDIEGLV